MEEEEKRRAEFTAAKYAELEARRLAGEQKASYIREVQQSMELVVEARKQEILGKEKEHQAIKEKAEAERSTLMHLAATEKEMRHYTRQLKLARHQRREEYRRHVVAAKIQLQDQRTEDLLQRQQATLARRKNMRANSVLARQAVTERLEKMRSSSAFEVDDEMRSNIQNPGCRSCSSGATSARAAAAAAAAAAARGASRAST